jgi:hypothetical protein
MPLPLLPSLSFAAIIIITTTTLSVTAVDFAAQCRYRRCRLCHLLPSFPLPLLPSPSLPLPLLLSMSFAAVFSIAAAAITVFAATAAAVYVVCRRLFHCRCCHHCLCRYRCCCLCRLPPSFPLLLLPSPSLPLPLRLQQTSTSSQPVQAMDLLSEGIASVMDNKIQTMDDQEGNDGNKQR